MGKDTITRTCRIAPAEPTSQRSVTPWVESGPPSAKATEVQRGVVEPASCRSCSIRLAATCAARLWIRPRPIIRVTSADEPAKAPMPTPRITTATITSTRVRPSLQRSAKRMRAMCAESGDSAASPSRAPYRIYVSRPTPTQPALPAGWRALVYDRGVRRSARTDVDTAGRDRALKRGVGHGRVPASRGAARGGDDVARGRDEDHGAA